MIEYFFQKLQDNNTLNMAPLFEFKLTRIFNFNYEFSREIETLTKMLERLSEKFHTYMGSLEPLADRHEW